MAFNWKMAKKRAVRKMKERVQIYLKHGRNTESDELKRRIKRVEQNAS